MAIVYQTLTDGTVQTQNGDGSWSTPMASAAEAALFSAHVAPWQPLVTASVAKYGLPEVLIPGILAIIHSESGGNANSGPSFDNGVGLMAITSNILKAKPGGGLYTADELKDPELNIDIGVGKMVAPEYGVMGLDLPQIASGFNGGYDHNGAHHSVIAPWGWREYQIPSTGAFPYISKVVRMNNYAISTLGPTSPPPPDDSSGSDDIGPWFAAAAVAVLLGVLWSKR